MEIPECSTPPGRILYLASAIIGRHPLSYNSFHTSVIVPPFRESDSGRIVGRKKASPGTNGHSAKTLYLAFLSSIDQHVKPHFHVQTPVPAPSFLQSRSESRKQQPGLSLWHSLPSPGA
ncbi:hypothetical protein FRC03_003259 [Tulasnella sp. 419]|nr:hypothetical protein FRC03_003259 [Tulasnella sp. 419]